MTNYILNDDDEYSLQNMKMDKIKTEIMLSIDEENENKDAGEKQDYNQIYLKEFNPFDYIPRR